ncbi:MAG: NADH:flavin oxidoreductase [Pseudomonadota bacterium]
MVKLFERTEINGLQLSNRFIRAATWEGMATEEGACTPRLTEHLTRLAGGGIGLIITSHAYIRTEGQAQPWQLGIYKDDFIDGLREMTRAVHKQGGRIVLQLSHAGLMATPRAKDEKPMALSLVEGYAKAPLREMTGDDIHGLVDAFAMAARRAKEAGFDGVEIHVAHGYLLSQSLSPLFNRRRDDYGGSLENRARFALEVLQAVRGAVAPDYPVLVKLNSQDFLEGGLTLEDSLQVGALLEEGGIDAIELSGGTFFSKELAPARKGISTEEKEAYFRDAAKSFKEKLNVPLILVGGIRSFPVAEKLVSEGFADYISMCRPLIREPDLVKRWERGDTRKAECLSDLQCSGAAWAGDGIHCVVEKKLMEKK